MIHRRGPHDVGRSVQAIHSRSLHITKFPDFKANPFPGLFLHQPTACDSLGISSGAAVSNRQGWNARG
jgi:hypothetical protein